MSKEGSPEVNRLVDHLFRHQHGQLVATLTRIFGPDNIDLAETVVQEALLKACQTWPFRGIPENPGGWLTTVAKNEALDLIRRQQRFRRKEREIVDWYESRAAESGAIDDQLGLIFTCCHPSLSRKSQVCLTLKTIGGFSVGEIAGAYLSSEASIRRLLGRAKEKLRQERVTFEPPEPREQSERIESVLEVLYLIFTEGYSAHEGDALVRADFCDESIRLTSLLLEGRLDGSPKHPTTKALLALMLFQSARIPARLDADGDLLLLSEQDRSQWDKKRIALGAHLLAEAATGDELSVYHLEAHIAACHASAPSYKHSDWPRILAHYDRLIELNPSPVVALNRAVAVSMIEGPGRGLAEVKLVASDPALRSYHLLPATLADLYRRLGDKPKALAEYGRAFDLAGTSVERRYLEKRMKEVSDTSGGKV